MRNAVKVRRGGVNVGLLIVLAIVALAAVTFWVYRWSSAPSAEIVQQPEGEEQMVTLFVTDGTSFEYPLSKAIELEKNEDGMYKNPRTGEFNVTWSFPSSSRRFRVPPQ